MARHLAPFSCRQTMAEIVRRRSWGGVLPLGRHASISGSRLIQCASDSIAVSSFREGQNARHHNRFKLEQALAISKDVGDGADQSLFASGARKLVLKSEAGRPGCTCRPPEGVSLIAWRGSRRAT